MRGLGTTSGGVPAAQSGGAPYGGPAAIGVGRGGDAVMEACREGLRGAAAGAVRSLAEKKNAAGGRGGKGEKGEKRKQGVKKKKEREIKEIRTK